MMSAQGQLSVRVDDASQVASARRAASDLASRLGFDDTRTGKVALLATEAATNLLKHGRGGEMLIRAIGDTLHPGVEILALDSGPGIDSLEHSMTDGISSVGTSGTGLGAMQRIADAFEVYSQPGKGTIVCMRLRRDVPATPESHAELGAVCLPMPGETACGDAWAARLERQSGTVMVADGLGHGPDAAVAAQAAVAVLDDHPSWMPGQMIEQAHGLLRTTRGAAVAVARLDSAGGKLVFAGVGNIAASVVSAQGRQQLVSHNGIVGSNVRKIQEFVVPWRAGDVLIMHSDGLGTQWSPDAYPRLFAHDPSIIAAALYRDFWRRRDDVTVVAVR